jgi:nucleotide-binding universal stress UspA family protein
MVAGYPAAGEFDMREIRHILCPLDLSDVSRHALDHAVLLSRWYKARMTGLHVWNPIVLPTTAFSFVGPPVPSVPFEERARVQQEVAEMLGRAGAMDAEVLVQNGRPANQILECAAAIPADVIVMGTHGSSGFEHLLLGSVTEKVLHRAACPVLTVPPQARATSKLPFRRILCPVDFSDPSLAALEFALSLAQEGDADLIILHVFEWPADGEPLVTRSFSVPEYLLIRERDAKTKLDDIIPESVRAWCRPVTRVAHGKAYHEIIGVAAEESADLIVMGVHGGNALDLMLFGSTTNQVVRRATCPVLTLRR